MEFDNEKLRKPYENDFFETSIMQKSERFLLFFSNGQTTQKLMQEKNLTFSISIIFSWSHKINYFSFIFHDIDQ